MSKIKMKPGNMLYPLPAVLVTCGDAPENYNVLTLAWAGTVNTNPPMVSISIRPERHSYEIIKRTGEFVINLTTEAMVFETDYCGVKSGRDENKFEAMKLETEPAEIVKAPLLKASPVNIECKVRQIMPLGSHDMIIADVVAVQANDQYMDKKNQFHLNDSKLLCYSHGRYFGLSEELGSFGYSVNKKKPEKTAAKKKVADNPAAQPAAASHDHAPDKTAYGTRGGKNLNRDGSYDKNKRPGTSKDSSYDKNKRPGTAKDATYDKNNRPGTSKDASYDKNKRPGTAKDSSYDKNKRSGSSKDSYYDKAKSSSTAKDNRRQRPSENSYTAWDNGPKKADPRLPFSKAKTR